MAFKWIYMFLIIHASILSYTSESHVINADDDIINRRITRNIIQRHRSLKFKDASPDALFEVKIPHNCTHGICERIENYPYELVRKAAAEIGFDTIRELGDPIPPKIEVTRRQGSEYMDMCLSEKMYIKPEAIKQNGTWFIVVNLQYEILQGFEVRLCAHETKCSSMLSAAFQGYCAQEFVQRMMYVIGDNGKITKQLIDTPLYCTCKVKPI